MLISTEHHYYSSVSTFYVQPGSKIMFIGKHRWLLKNEPKGENGDCLVSMEDLNQLFSPDWTSACENGRVRITVPGMEIECTEGSSTVTVKKDVDNRQVDIKTPVQNVDGQIYIPVQGFFTAVCGANCAQRDNFYMVSDTKTEIHPKEDFLHMHNISLDNKKYGYFYEAFWYEPAKRIVPYRLYVPSTYQKGTPQKMIVALHGANSDHHVVFERGDGKLALLAEERGYLILAVNGLFHRSFYGYCYPTSGGVNSNFKGPKDNPLQLTDLQFAQRKMSQECVFAQIEKVMEDYTIDKDHVYMMGNSMGGAGTIWLAGQRPQMFKAISPSGGNVSPDYFDVTSIKDVPTLFVVGTEDEFGACHQDAAAKRFKEGGCDYQMYRVGGGNHSFGWTYALDKSFDFFDQHQ
ncbi:MAG TPA: prolyl oligopeptidase family serine peptidase [Candidatus Enterocloster faecavium]|uniref:Prolyl oligopeptidase family serine peptidase n=1 Tax=Candidatus Enterocloster faecavium TaxID=2838560 RepID=A0A9D2RLD9_9FIRM|nr:prolyl oligopeptidase family serine peptidase [Candidatus Enterocloster faecavium]